jgi:hypothetical protein
MAVAKKESFDTWFGTAAEMATFASMVRGDKFITTDTKIGYVYTGAAWIVDPQGAFELSGSGVTVGDPLFVSLATKLQAALDSIDVSKMSKGGVTVAHNAITATATSAEIPCAGFNAIMLEITQSAAEAWTYTVQGCMVTGGTFVDIYEMANTGALALMTVVENTLSRILVFKGIPDYIKIVATEVAGTATVTVKVQPLNL